MNCEDNPTYSKRHPERRPGERFYSNFSNVETAQHCMGDRPYRIGEQAYDYEGDPVSGVPVFIPNV